MTWVNDCEYELRIEEGRKEIMDFYKEKVLKIKIIETFDDGYKFSGSVEGFDYEYYQTLTRIQE